MANITLTIVGNMIFQSDASCILILIFLLISYIYMNINMYRFLYIAIVLMARWHNTACSPSSRPLQVALIAAIDQSSYPLKSAVTS